MMDMPDAPDLREDQQFNPRHATRALVIYASRMDAMVAESAKQTGTMLRLTWCVAGFTLLNLIGVGVQVWLALK